MHAIIHTWRYMPLLAWMWTMDGFAGLRMKLNVSQFAGLGAVASTLVPPPWTALTNRLLKTRNWYTPADTLHICSTSRSTPQVDWIRAEAQAQVPFFLVHPHDFSLKIATRTCFRTNTNIHCLQHFFLQLFLTNLEQSSWIYNEIYRLIFVVVFYIIHSFIPFPVNLLLQIYNRYIFL